MALSIKYQKVFGVPVSPDSISTGSVSLASYPAITGDYIATVNIALKTYTFNLQGINEELATEIVNTCDANAEALAKGQIDLSNPTGQGSFSYRNATLIPMSYEDGGTLDVGGTTKNYSSFNVTCISNILTANV